MAEAAVELLGNPGKDDHKELLQEIRLMFGDLFMKMDKAGVSAVNVYNDIQNGAHGLSQEVINWVNKEWKNHKRNMKSNYFQER